MRCFRVPGFEIEQEEVSTFDLRSHLSWSSISSWQPPAAMTVFRLGMLDSLHCETPFVLALPSVCENAHSPQACEDKLDLLQESARKSKHS